MQWYHILLIVIFILLTFLVIMFFKFLETFTIKKQSQSAFVADPSYAKYVNTIRKNIEYFETVDKEEVYVNSFDNLKLKGHLIECENSKKVVIFFHGFKSSYKTDLTNAGSYIKKGYSVLTVEQRAHGGSEGRFITFGVLERYDVVSWINYVISRYGNDVEIVLMGVSMGASTIMMASELNLPNNVKAILCDCGYTSPKQEISYYINHYYHLPAFPLVNILDLFCRIFAKFSLNGANCYESLKKSNIPTFIIHGDGDDFVPYSCSIKNYSGCNMEIKEFVTIKCDVHAVSYLEDMQTYQNKLDEFLKRINF